MPTFVSGESVECLSRSRGYVLFSSSADAAPSLDGGLDCLLELNCGPGRLDALRSHVATYAPPISSDFGDELFFFARSLPASACALVRLKCADAAAELKAEAHALCVAIESTSICLALAAAVRAHAAAVGPLALDVRAATVLLFLLHEVVPAAQIAQALPLAAHMLAAADGSEVLLGHLQKCATEVRKRDAETGCGTAHCASGRCNAPNFGENAIRETS